jgi:hypothetical protein
MHDYSQFTRKSHLEAPVNFFFWSPSSTWEKCIMTFRTIFVQEIQEYNISKRLTSQRIALFLTGYIQKLLRDRGAYYFSPQDPKSKNVCVVNEETLGERANTGRAISAGLPGRISRDLVSRDYISQSSKRRRTWHAMPFASLQSAGPLWRPAPGTPPRRRVVRSAPGNSRVCVAADSSHGFAAAVRRACGGGHRRGRR